MNPSAITSHSEFPHVPPHVAELTAMARCLLGLSKSKQVRRQIDSMTYVRRRLSKMRQVVLAGSRNISAAYARISTRVDIIMITLTYAPGVEYHPRHVSEFIDRARKHLTRRKLPTRIVWVHELQRRGATHFHVLFWVPKGFKLPKPDEQGWWPHGSTKIELTRNAPRYLAKYMSKGSTDYGAIPKGARLYGVGGCPVHLGYWRAPMWLQLIASPTMKIQKRKQGWWTVQELAHAWKSPWHIILEPGGELLVTWVGWNPSTLRSILEVERLL